MNTTEIALLQKEMSFLRQLVAAKDTEIAYLKECIAYLKKGNASEEEFLSNLNFEVGKTEHSLSNPKSEVGKTEHSLSNPKNEVGKTEHSLSNLKSEVGKTEHSLSNLKKEVGKTEDFGRTSTIEVGKTELPAHIPITEQEMPYFLGVFTGLLKDNGFLRASYSATANAARLLLHLHHSTAGDYPTLRKVTRLSQGGLAKFLASAKKRGLIVRQGFQQFALTDSGRALLWQAYQKFLQNPSPLVKNSG